MKKNIQDIPFGVLQIEKEKHLIEALCKKLTNGIQTDVFIWMLSQIRHFNQVFFYIQPNRWFESVFIIYIYIYLSCVYIISKTITKYKYNGVAALGIEKMFKNSFALVALDIQVFFFYRYFLNSFSLC